jgi:hypothetical protein
VPPKESSGSKAAAEERNHDPAGPTRLCDRFVVVIIIVIVLVTASAYVAEAVPGHVVAVAAAVVAGAAPPAALISVLPIVGRMCDGSVRRRALHRESRCNPVGSQSAASRRRGCGNFSCHHRRLCRRHCSGWYCSSFRQCCYGHR